MVKYTQTIRWLLPTISLSVFDHFMGLALKGLRSEVRQTQNDEILFPEAYLESSRWIHLRWSFFAKIVHDFQQFTIFVYKLHRRYSNWF